MYIQVYWAAKLQNIKLIANDDSSFSLYFGLNGIYETRIYMLKLLKALIPNRIKAPIRNMLFRRKGGSPVYWEQRYSAGGTSGCGSYGKLAEFKAEVIKAIIKEHDIKSIIELGSGDGNQISITFDNPDISYLGFDVSKTAITMCMEKFKDDISKDFILFDALRATNKICSSVVQGNMY